MAMMAWFAPIAVEIKMMQRPVRTKKSRIGTIAQQSLQMLPRSMTSATDAMTGLLSVAI
ncbi:MAG TPA: hypothetical protein VFH31_06895 [Pyrinomonadaceae bacterium]|nr:hypothetical protein [Pyrinomonadaceae bacterium]